MRGRNCLFFSEGPCELHITPVGCYKENKDQRALQDEIYNEKNPTNPNFGGKMLDTSKWQSEFPEFLCKCARNARARNHQYFGVQNFGNESLNTVVVSRTHSLTHSLTHPPTHSHTDIFRWTVQDLEVHSWFSQILLWQ